MTILWQMIAVIVIWWVANGITSIAAKFMFEQRITGHDNVIVNESFCEGLTPAFKDLRWLELTTLQLLFGAVASVLLLKALNGKSTSIWPNNSETSHKVTVCVAIVANIVGNLAINMEYTASYVTLNTEIVKVGEPVITFLLSLRLYNHDDFTLRTVFSVLAVTAVAGITYTCVLLSSASTFSVCGLFATFFSVVGFSTRNIYLKKLSWESVLQKYAVVSIGSILLLVPATLLKLVIMSTHTNSGILSGGVIASIFHFIYNAASITVLEDVGPLTHAILNLSRRVCVVIANLIYFNSTPYTLALIAGVAFFVVGIVLYFRYKNTTIGRTSIRISALLCIVMIGLSISKLMLSTNQSTTRQNSEQVHDIYAITPRTELDVTKATRPMHRDYSLNLLSPQLSKDQQIAMAWAFERDLPQAALDNIQSLQTMNPDSHIHVYCGTSQCIRALTNFSVTTEFLVVSELVKDTPLEPWVARHPLNKVLAGIEFEHHLQIVTQLGLLWQHGGIYVNPMVKIADNTKLPSCQNGWISKDDASSILDISCFPRYHPLIQNIMENFVHDYPKKGSDHSAFRFSFTDVVESAYKSCTPKNNCNANYVDLKYTVNNPTKSLDHHFGTLSYDSRVIVARVANLGDEIQGFPGMQFLPFVDQFLERDKLSKLRTNEPVTVFLNAWWGDTSMNWPPPNNVHPIMTSVHIEGAIQGMWGSKIDYLNSNAPIGCRDFSTLEFLRKKNVDSYFSGCLTLMLKNPSVSRKRTNKIYLVDVKKEISELLPAEIKENGIPIKHYVQTRDSLQRYTDSFELVESYASAKLVVTQRIHCALPCVAMGIPVVFINSAGMPGGGGSKTHSSARIVGLTPLFNTVDMYKMSHEEAKKWFHDFDWNNPPPNPNVNMMMRMRATFWDVIRKNPVLYDTAHKFGMVPLHPPPALPSEHHELLFHLLFTTSSESTVGLFGGGGSMKGAFNWRHWRTVESIFHHHPFARVIIHSNTLQQSEFDVLTEAGYTIEVQSYNLEDMIRNSPAKDFMGKLESASKGGYWYSHLTDLLRLLVLYKWGGIYMDTDMIVVRPVNSLKNVLGYQNKYELNGAFMAFEKDNPYIRDCLVDYAHNYDSDWASNGPKLVTRNYIKWKNDSSVVSALLQHAFYMFSFHDVSEQCFGNVTQTLYEAKMEILKEEAYTVHLNSKITGKKGINDKLVDGTLCKYILNTYCVLCDRQY